MLQLLAAFFISYLLVSLIVRFKNWHGRLSMDRDLGGVQKVHAVAVPRIGGVGIAAAVAMTSIAYAALNPFTLNTQALMLLACSLPAFLSGLVEDLTKKVSPSIRLVTSMIAALLACFALRAVIGHVGLSFVDALLYFLPVSIVFTVFAVSGLVHAINIIDGMNGLASVVAIIILSSIAVVAWQVGDELVMHVAVVAIGATLGFFAWNYPVSRIFLGDGGAYFIGFIVAELLVLLIERNSGVSPLYAILVSIYPAFETLFSIYRRKVLRGLPAGAPDAIHLHTLIYRRIVEIGAPMRDLRAVNRRNSRTSPYLWTLTLGAVVPATLFWRSPSLLMAFVAMFIVTYIWLYQAIVRFRTPGWLRQTGR
ncbi:MraY family glycosyltransferase [Caballeronia fortuita]|nr:glycosyltransferase [Caballeronia fortuita]